MIGFPPRLAARPSGRWLRSSQPVKLVNVVVLVASFFALRGFCAASEIAASCPTSDPLLRPPLSGASRDDVAVIRGLIDGGHWKAARARWAALSGWHPGAGATAYGRADAAFSARSYAAAFQLYHQSIFCGDTSELNPQAQDSGATKRLSGALTRAGNGDFGAAERILRKATAGDPNSIESRYFLGLVAEARGDATGARKSWKAAIDDPGYAQPPDGWTINRAQEAALQRYLSPGRIPL